MLTLNHDGKQYPLQNTEYYIRELANGLDEVIFTLPIHDDIYASIAEEEQVTDRAGQTYKVKQIDAGANDAKVVCQLDIDAWRSTLNVNYNSGTKTVAQQITAVLPSGWTLNDRAHINIGRTIEGDMTPYDICVRCTEVYSVYIRWNNKTKVCTIYPKAMGTPVGSFATRELNLKEINYKGKSNDLVTRLYAYGKDGLSFADINSGKAYVDNFTYTNKVICGIWRDERYTVAADLLADAQERLAQMAKPVRTYECSIVDLQATNPELYNNLDFSLFTAATLIDDIKDNAVDYQVVERHIFPYHPEMNEVIFNSEPLKITASVVTIADAIENPSSTFQQIQAQRIASATNWLTSGDGYVVARKGPNGEWKELLFMDTDDEATAQQVIRINENGIGFSKTGINGPYTNAWTIDGELVADFITTGTMQANRISGGTLTLGGQNNGDGTCVVKDNSNNTKVTLNNAGITAEAGYIGTAAQGWVIGADNIHNGLSSFTDNINEGVYVGVDGIRYNQSPTSQSPLAYTKISKLGIDCQTAITSTGGFFGGTLNTGKGRDINAYNSSGASTFSVTGASGNIATSGDITADGGMQAHDYKTVSSGSIYTGQNSDTFIIQNAYVDGGTHNIGLTFKHGLLVGYYVGS